MYEELFSIKHLYMLACPVKIHLKMHKKEVEVNGNGNVVVTNVENSTIKVIQELKNDSNDLFVTEWLGQIDNDLRTFNPKTALNHLEKVIKAFTSKGNMSESLQARIAFLRGICLYEWNDSDDWINCFILAYDYEPSHTLYMEKAIVAYFKSKDTKIALEIAELLLKQDKNNPIACALKLYLDESHVIPNMVLKITKLRQRFKGTFAQFCLFYDCQERIDTIFEVEPIIEPIDIDFDNKGYWLLFADYRLAKLTIRQPILMTPLALEISSNPNLKKAVADLKHILKAFEQTEKYQKLMPYRFLLAYGEYLLGPNFKSVQAVKQQFDGTSSAFQNKYLFLMAMIKMQVEDYQGVLHLLAQPYHNASLHYIKAYAYLKLDRQPEAEQTASLYFEQSLCIKTHMLGHFGLFQNIIIDSDEKRSYYFKHYQHLKKYENPAIEKLAELISFASQYPKEKIVSMVEACLKIEDFKTNKSIIESLSMILLSLNYMGIQLTYSIALTEFDKYINKEPNLYMNCLENLDLESNGHITLRLIGHIYSNQHLEIERKKVECQRVFQFVLKRTAQKGVIELFVPYLECLFETCLPNWLAYIREDFVIACKGYPLQEN